MQRGVAAAEFALVMPTILVLLCAIAGFGSALYSKQLLYDVAGETLRTCVLKNVGTFEAYDQCTKTIGAFLTTSGNVHRDVCMGAPVSFDTKIRNAEGGSTPSYQTQYEVILSLEVTASCNWTFAPGFVGVLGALASPDTIYARASMPYLSSFMPL